MAPTSCFTGQFHRLPDAPEAYGAMTPRAKAALPQSRSTDRDLEASRSIPELEVARRENYLKMLRASPASPSTVETDTEITAIRSPVAIRCHRDPAGTSPATRSTGRADLRLTDS